MGWMFELSPVAAEGYDDDAVREMGEYVRGLPAVYQRSDGYFVLVQDEAAKDWIETTRTVDEPRDYFEHIYIRKKHVVLSVEVSGFRLEEVVRFLEWSTKRWPAMLLSSQYGTLDIARFLDIMDSNRWK